jgi:hypothetical protein
VLLPQHLTVPAVYKAQVFESAVSIAEIVVTDEIDLGVDFAVVDPSPNWP